MVGNDWPAHHRARSVDEKIAQGDLSYWLFHLLANWMCRGEENPQSTHLWVGEVKKKTKARVIKTEIIKNQSKYAGDKVFVPVCILLLFFIIQDLLATIYYSKCHATKCSFFFYFPFRPKENEHVLNLH